MLLWRLSSWKIYMRLLTRVKWITMTLDNVSNHQAHHCLLGRLFGRRSKKTSKLRVTGLCVGNSPGTGEFPAQMASYAENVSIRWRHYGQDRFPHRKHRNWRPVLHTHPPRLPYIHISVHQDGGHPTRDDYLRSLNCNLGMGKKSHPWLLVGLITHPRPNFNSRLTEPPLK